MDKQIEEFENYLRNVKKTKENTVLSYLRDLRILLEAMERRGIYDAKDITEDVLSSFFAGLKEEHRANSSVIRNYTIIILLICQSKSNLISICNYRQA